MFSESKVLIYKWLWNTEAHYENLYNDKLQHFLKHREHFFQDYLYLYVAEKELQDFRAFSRDLSKILESEEFGEMHK